jgi:imidazolonepropionase-like amidohydrolase
MMPLIWVRFRFVAIAALWAFALSANAASPIAFVGARVIPIEGAEIEKGVVVVSGTKITAVGAVDAVTIPADAQRIDVAGKVIMPGIICTHSHVGGGSGGDGSGPIQPGVRILDSINVRDNGFRRAIAGGLTTLNIMPGSGHLSSGQTIYVKLRYADGGPRKIEDLFIRDADGGPIGGLKMANGTNSQREGTPFPETRGRSASLVRQEFIRAREYQAKLAAAGDDASKRPPRDLNLESLVEVLEKKRVVHHHTHRHDDIMTVLRLAKEFDFRVVLHHVSDGWAVAPEIAAAGVPCSVILIDSPGGKLEAHEAQFGTGRILDEAGVRVAFHTDDAITDSRNFTRMPALAVRAGMSRQKALESLTLAGAEILDLQDRIGSLKAGKDADLVVLDGDPFSVYTHVLETWVEGKKVFDRARPEDRLYQVGGYGAGSEGRGYMCCFEGQIAADEAQRGGHE